MTLVLDLSSELSGHVAVAISDHRKKLRRQGMPAPAGLAELLALLTSKATEGQRGTALADLWEFSDSPHVPQMLMTYEEAAQALACSDRQIKRLVKAGDLTAVLIGGLTRLRVADVNAYVATLPAKRAVA